MFQLNLIFFELGHCWNARFVTRDISNAKKVSGQAGQACRIQNRYCMFLLLDRLSCALDFRSVSFDPVVWLMFHIAKGPWAMAATGMTTWHRLCCGYSQKWRIFTAETYPAVTYTPSEIAGLLFKGLFCHLISERLGSL